MGLRGYSLDHITHTKNEKGDLTWLRRNLEEASLLAFMLLDKININIWEIFTSFG
jgi:hypothetical protein